MKKKKIHCPKCGGTNCTYHTRGYSWGKGCLGFLLLNVFGLLLGCFGHSKKICRCNDCGKQWEMN